MAFRFRMVDRDGEDRGTFTSSEPSWKAGDDVMLAPRKWVRIVEARESDHEALAGVWVIEARD